MFDAFRLNRQREYKMIRKYFEEEVSLIEIPAPPRISGNGVKYGGLLPHLKEIAAVAVTAAALVLFTLTAGKGTLLSQKIDTAIAHYNVRAEITGFLEKAGEVYRSGFNGG